MPPIGLIPMFLKDPYDRVARLYPGLLTLLPLVVLLSILYGTSNIFLTITLAIFSSCGGGYALGNIARNAGKRIQDRMFCKWGGAPSTQLLRFRNSHFDIHTKERYHSVLGKLLGKPLPDCKTEEADPEAADELYKAAVVLLINATRDVEKFPLVFKENIAFGFNRNILGLRRIGIIIALISCFWTLLHSGAIMARPPYFLAEKLGTLSLSALISLAVSCLMLFAWTALFNEATLRRVGFSYAERLIESCNNIDSAAQKGQGGLRGRAANR